MLANVNEEEKNKMYMSNKKWVERVFCLSKSTTMSSVSDSIDIIHCFFPSRNIFSCGFEILLSFLLVNWLFLFSLPILFLVILNLNTDMLQSLDAVSCEPLFFFFFFLSLHIVIRQVHPFSCLSFKHQL